MNRLFKHQSSFPETRVATSARRSERLTAIVAGLLLMMIFSITGCGGGEGETGANPTVTVNPGAPGSASASASLAWNPVPDSTVSAYFVHYGRHPAGQSGSCAYESSVHASAPSATVTNLEPNTTYYFAVSAYNGLESACSNEVSTVTPPSAA